ncbi:hypothetical protein GCHA_3267 [Paraglaciecola chathamensis S18K6]|uniref:Uncharacterized protein n=1 Tax=Paraglaciecola chathamensis S18K6 TaxID=1127672 RepID=A0AAV3V328_9ALTE|nr:hypothetical protein GCHA_3267 [Paraglaciecola chathamensis S18K6]
MCTGSNKKKSCFDKCIPCSKAQETPGSALSWALMKVDGINQKLIFAGDDSA